MTTRTEEEWRAEWIELAKRHTPWSFADLLKRTIEVLMKVEQEMLAKNDYEMLIVGNDGNDVPLRLEQVREIQKRLMELHGEIKTGAEKIELEALQYAKRFGMQ
jgi:hypothetical protein